MENDKKSGSCLCGAVKFDVTGPLGDITMCHCGQCQKTSGHHFAATGAASKDITIGGEEFVKWYKSSDYAERGFCRECGSSLFWRMPSRDMISIMVGSFDGDISLPVVRHYFVEDKKSYYELRDDAEKFDTFPPGIA